MIKRWTRRRSTAVKENYATYQSFLGSEQKCWLCEQNSNGSAHLAGAGSFRIKKFKEFCQFRLNLLIKISNIPDLKKFDPGFQKLWPKKDIFLFITRLFFVLEKNSKNNGGVKFFSKFDF